MSNEPILRIGDGDVMANDAVWVTARPDGSHTESVLRMVTLRSVDPAHATATTEAGEVLDYFRMFRQRSAAREATRVHALTRACDLRKQVAILQREARQWEEFAKIFKES